MKMLCAFVSPDVEFSNKGSGSRSSCQPSAPWLLANATNASEKDCSILLSKMDEDDELRCEGRSITAGAEGLKRVSLRSAETPTGSVGAGVVVERAASEGRSLRRSAFIIKR